MDLMIKVSGCEEISAALKKLPEDLQVKYGELGLKRAAEMAVMAVKSRMPIATGLAKKSIGISRIKHYPQSGTLFVAVEPQKGFRRIVSLNPGLKVKIHSRKTQSVFAELGRIQNPQKYMHIIEMGRRAVAPTKKRALHSALDVENRFFMRAKAVLPHPVFQPARDAVEGATKIAIEIELNKGVEEWNARQTASSAV
jgi:hypothetical protein